MTKLVILNDEDVRGNCFHSVRLPFEKDEITVEALIKLRIETEIKKFNALRPLCFFSLVQPESAEVTLKGYRLKKHRDIDWRIQYDIAKSAFINKAFLISQSGKDYQSLDDVLTLSDTSENYEFEIITFVRFFEMIGG